VLRALRERRIPVDVVCGTSAGALIGGQFAMGHDDRDLEQRNCAIFGGARRRILDYTLPVTSVVGSVRLNEKLGELFGDDRIEDTWVPLLCTVTDLTAGQTRTYDRGLLRRVVRASCSMPIVFPPVVEAGHLLADGGILDNLPIGPLLERVDVGTLVVVDVTKPFQAAEGAYTYDDCLPLWRVLNGRFNPFATRLVSPGIVDVLLRAIEIGARSLDPTQIERADLFVRPDFGDLSYTDTSRIPDAVRAGHDAAQRLLDGWDPSGIPFR
jgi:predicted acylesterase/phospholipase RssA